MERMGGLPRSRHAKSNSASNAAKVNCVPNLHNSHGNPGAANHSAANPSNAAAQRAPQQECVVREQDQYMPIANVIRIMRRILPPHAKISDDAKETIQECVSEYIAFITGEANERCQREQRKTVTAEDVLWAMGKLGFDNYVEPLTLFLQKYRESENSDHSSLRGEFVKRERLMMDFGPSGSTGPNGPQVAMLPPPPIFGPGYPVAHHGAGMFDSSGGPMGPPFRDGSGNSSSGRGGSSSSSGTQKQNSMAGFDPFAHFK